MIDQFIADTETKFAKISKPDVGPISLASALRTRIGKKKLDNKAGVRQRKGKVYLLKL